MASHIKEFRLEESSIKSALQNSIFFLGEEIIEVCEVDPKKTVVALKGWPINRSGCTICT